MLRFLGAIILASIVTGISVPRIRDKLYPVGPTVPGGTTTVTGPTQDTVKVDVRRALKDTASVTVGHPSDIPLYVRETDALDTYVMSNPQNPEIPFVCANSMPVLRNAACAEIRDILKRTITDKATTRSDVAAVLQHYTLPLLTGHETSGALVQSQPNKYKKITLPVINVPEAFTYSANDILFSLPEEDRNLFPSWFKGDMKIRLPRGTRVQFLHFPAGIAPESFVARLERRDCFRVDMTVVPLSPWSEGTLPEGYELGLQPDPSPQIITYPNHIQIHYSIQRVSANLSCNQQDYERWVTDILASFRARLEN